MRRIRLVAAIACLAAACSPDGEPAMRAHELSLAVSENEAFAAWHGGPTGSSIYVQKLDEQGRPESAPIRINEGTRLAYEPDLVTVEEQLAIAWYERDRSRKLSAWLAGLSRDGQREWIAALAARGDQARNPVVRLIGNVFHAAWIEHGDRDDDPSAAIWYQRFSREGAEIAPPLQIGRASRETWNLNAGVYDGAFIVAYDAALGTKAHELHMIAVRDGRAHHRALSEDDGHASLYPDLQFGSSGRAALTWFDERDGNQEVYLLTGDGDALGSLGTVGARRISYTSDDSIGAYLAWNGDVIGLAWSDRMGGRRDIFTQQFSVEGRPVSPVYRVGSSREHAGVPAIQARNDGFLIAWNDYVLRGDSAHMDVVSSRARVAQVPISR